jgi:hypothetical protein
LEGARPPLATHFAQAAAQLRSGCREDLQLVIPTAKRGHTRVKKFPICFHPRMRRHRLLFA